MRVWRGAHVDQIAARQAGCQRSRKGHRLSARLSSHRSVHGTFTLHPGPCLDGTDVGSQATCTLLIKVNYAGNDSLRFRSKVVKGELSRNGAWYERERIERAREECVYVYVCVCE